MKHNLSRLLSLLLAVVMLVGVLPLTAEPVAAETEETSQDYNFNEVEFWEHFDTAIIDTNTLTGSGFVSQSLPTSKSSDGTVTATGEWAVVNDDTLGDKCLQYTKTGTATLYAQHNTGVYGVSGETYILSFSVKGSGKPVLYFRYDNGGSNLISERWNVEVTSDWSTYSVQITAGEYTKTNEFQVWYGYEGSASGTVYFDDFKIERVVDPHLVVSDEVAYSADFSTSNGYVTGSSVGNWRNSSNFAYDSETQSLKMTYGSSTTSSQIWLEPSNGVGVIVGNTYTYEVWWKGNTSGSHYFYVGGSTANGSSWSGGYSSSCSSVRIDGEWTVYTLQFTATDSVPYLRLLIGFSGGTAGDIVYFKGVEVTESWSIDNALAYGKELKLMADTTVTDFDLGEKGVLDLNGYTLTANSVDGTLGGTLVDNSANKTGRVIVGTGTDENGDTYDKLFLAPTNPQLPVKSADGSYALATVNLGDAYIKQTDATEDGFTLIFRPGFGTQEIVDMVGSGNSGVDMSLELTWTDVWGQSPEEPTTIKNFGSVVASAYKNRKAIYAKFTNPGDTYQFVVKVNVTSTTGVTISSDVTADDATYVNPTEAAKTYLFAHNFNDSNLIGDTSKSIAPMRGTENLVYSMSTSYAAPTFDGTCLTLDGETLSQQINYPDYIDDKSTYVIEMKVRVLENTHENSKGKSAIELFVIRQGTTDSTTFRRQWPVKIGDTGTAGAANWDTLYLYQSELNGNGADCKLTNVATTKVASSDDEWTLIKISINYATNKVTLTVDGVEVGSVDYIPTTASLNPYFYMCRTKDYQHFAMDDIKIYYITPSAE